MPVWGWILIGIGAAAALVAFGVAAGRQSSRRRSARLRERFGPEYERTVRSAGDRDEAEGELEARERRRRGLEIRPLAPEARERYVADWRALQARFVDDPAAAAAAADGLIQSAMADRGYPVEDFEQRAADISVDHPQVVENYRAGHRLALASRDGGDSTEDLRQAMRHYRALFEELVEAPADEPLSRDAAATTTRDEEAIR